MPWLSAHLKAEAGPLKEARTVRNLAALGETISTGASPPHEVVLAAMFLDLMTAGKPDQYIPPQLSALRSGTQFDLVGELRRRGFARADTDFMRLIIEAFPHLMRPSRRTRKLMRRPYLRERTPPLRPGRSDLRRRFLDARPLPLRSGGVPGTTPHRSHRRCSATAPPPRAPWPPPTAMGTSRECGRSGRCILEWHGVEWA